MAPADTHALLFCPPTRCAGGPSRDVRSPWFKPDAGLEAPADGKSPGEATHRAPTTGQPGV
ncbi:hypothetical protein P280DRAFT_517098 [Massarina eburnea CBS 473.64]|uniref:Uncharacterized protein n=1 Tax=Massarina eburnea CBS 473.64 TaxID=1395130 RepID=A0A6A6S5U6_9PLEO|nr:hypothetical protein P280DRAFT_517098 [Massarina eburnea CBS 473.64]